jgi:hypothetical protein
VEYGNSTVVRQSNSKSVGLVQSFSSSKMRVDEQPITWPNFIQWKNNNLMIPCQESLKNYNLI